MLQRDRFDVAVTDWRGACINARRNLLPERYLPMAVRTFESPDGATWSVWEVIPDRVSEFRSTNGSHLPRDMADGWLCFDCGTEKRRLAPLPANWQERSEEDLRFWCRAAVPVRARGASSAACEPVPAAEAPVSEPAAMTSAEDGMAVAWRA
jgi:hypothetical protein